MTTETPIQQTDPGNEVSYNKQHLFNLIDVSLCYFPVTLVEIYRFPHFLFNWVGSIYSLLIVIALIIMYRLFCFLVFNRSIGMKLFRIKILNGEGKKLSIRDKILASFFLLYKGVGYYNG
jgi:uncharacterized RDD family membrane protein YckC